MSHDNLPSGFAHVGWFDSAAQQEPTSDPKQTAPCPICDRSWTSDDVRTHSVLSIGGLRSYFYRTHRTCADANPAAVEELDGRIVEALP